ncbi:oligosaccharide flippase family protein [Paenibacillus sp. HW567]|uniref:oligosaccharide flippase family protein n=1 Tax=Paenibacillus sp. HW567 TaxID=1034769 RepID=UPI000365E287|nr:oligosaccharide flippase family protein [Paenibacillus sp. HW567]
MRIPRLLKQSAIRAGAMLLVKLIGLAGRVLLTRLVGAEGIGLYQIAYSFYGFVLMLTGGIPTTLAIATAKAPSQGWKFLKIISLGMILSGGILSLLIYSNSSVISGWLGNPSLEYAVRSLAPSIFAVPLLSLARGYLQGMKQIGIIACSEIAEQLTRFLFMLLIIWQLGWLGIERAVGYGLYGTVIGAVLSFTLVTVYISINNKRFTFIEPFHRPLHLIWFVKTSLVISATRMLIPASEFIDALLISNRLLAAGYSTSEATAIYGVIYGMAVIIVYSPTLLTGALSHTVSMHIAAAWQQGNQQRAASLSSLALYACWLWGLVCGLFLFVYADELSFYIFNTARVNQVIRYLAFIPLIVGFREISTSILWAQDIRKNPFFGLLSGIICAVGIQYFLVALPGFSYKGAAAGILMLELVAACWNFRVLHLSMASLRQILLPLLYDLAFVFVTLSALSRLFHHSAEILSLWRFLLMSCSYFTLSGVYMYFRSIRKLL